VVVRFREITLATRKGEIMKTLLSTFALIMLLGAATAAPANAACFEGPGGVTCWHHPHYWHHGYWHRDYWRHDW